MRAWIRASRAAPFRRRADPGCLRECAAQLPQAGPQRSGAGDLDQPPPVVHPGQQRPDPEVDPDRRARPGVPPRRVLLHLDGERHEPPLSRPRHRGRQDARYAVVDLAGELGRRLVGLHRAEAGKRHRTSRAAHDAGEPEGVAGLPLLLPPGEPEPPALPLALLRLDVLPQSPFQVPKRLLIGALGVLRPPRQARVGFLLHVPDLLQLGRRVPLPSGLVALLAPGKPPVPREASRARMRPQRPLLGRRRIQRKPPRLDDFHRPPPFARRLGITANMLSTRYDIREIRSNCRMRAIARIRHLPITSEHQETLKTTATAAGQQGSSRRPRECQWRGLL
jgi:hypothetical protein